MATLRFINEGRCTGVWAGSRTNSFVTIQADATSASLMLYPDERGLGKELPFVIGVSHSIDKDELHGFIQIPTMTGERKTRYYTFADLIRALDASDELEKMKARMAAVERLLAVDTLNLESQ